MDVKMCRGGGGIKICLYPVSCILCSIIYYVSYKIYHINILCILLPVWLIFHISYILCSVLCIICVPYHGPVLIMYHMYPVSWTCINCVSYISCWRTCIDYVSNVSGILDLYLLCILYPEPVSIMYDTYSVSLPCIDYESCILSLYWLCFLYHVSWTCIDYVPCILYHRSVLIMN